MRNRHIIHIDMDAFYASVEQMDNPQLKGKPVIVGGGVRGVVSAASYEARVFGVRSAMPIYRAVKLCPQAVIVAVRISRYAEISRQIHRIFSDYTPLIEPLSLDEAFLDVTAGEHLFGGAINIGRLIKQRIKEQIGLVASVGIAENKFLAKLASDINKPDGFLVIDRHNKQQILDPLPVSRIWGVGNVTEKKLLEFGINTIYDLRNTSPVRLKNLLGNQGEQLLELAQGIDDREVESVQQAKSISTEDTFDTDIADGQTLWGVLCEQVELVAQRLRAQKLTARTVTIKFRYGNFKTITRSRTFDGHTDKTVDFLDAAKEIFEQWYKSTPGALRLIGFGVSGLSEHRGQAGLFDRGLDLKQRHLDSVVDRIRNKYGADFMKRGKI